MPPAAWITSLSVSFSASSRVFPMANSVAMLDVEMAPGHPWVKNLKADILPSSTLRKTLMKSPQVGSPTTASRRSRNKFRRSSAILRSPTAHAFAFDVDRGLLRGPELRLDFAGPLSSRGRPSRLQARQQPLGPPHGPYREGRAAAPPRTLPPGCADGSGPSLKFRTAQ